MTTTIEDGHLVIKVPLHNNPPVSSTGKSKLVASTNGFFKTGLTHLGQPVSVSLNVIIPNKP